MTTLPDCQATDNEIDALSRALLAVVDRHASVGASFAERESLALSVAAAATRKSLEVELQTIADQFGDALTVEGEKYRRHEEGVVKYFSLCGPLEVRRSSYRPATRVRYRGRNKRYRGSSKSVVALDVAAGMLMRTTPALAYSLAEGYARGPMRGYAAIMEAGHRQVPPRATLERKAKAIAGAAKQKVLAIEACLRRTETLPEGARAISIGLDRTSVAMIEERPQGSPPSTVRKERRTPHVRKPPEPFDVNWRMGYVGTVAIVDKCGETLVATRYGATAEEGPDELVGRVMADVTRALEQNRDLIVSVVQDGAPELWALIWEAMRERGIKKYRQTIDRYHVNQRLAGALALTEHDSVGRKCIYARWMVSLNRNDRAIQNIETWLRRRRSKVAKSNRAEFDAHLTYFAGNDLRIRYATMIRERLPIGSGVTEGTCKSLYAARTKRSGQRWYQDGLTGVLTLRALLLSNRLSRFWRHFAGSFQKSVQPEA